MRLAGGWPHKCWPTMRGSCWLWIGPAVVTPPPSTLRPDGAAADGAGLWLTPVRVVHRRLTHHASARPVVLAAAAIATATGVAATTILAVTTTGPRDAQQPGWMSASYQPLSWVSAAALLLLLLLVFSVHPRVPA